MCAHNIFSRRCIASENVLLLPGLISGVLKAAFPGCAGLNSQSLYYFSDRVHTQTHTDTHTYLYTSTSFKAHIIAKPIFRFQHSCAPVLHLKG